MGATSATSARSWRHSGCNVRKKEGMRKQGKKKKEERRKRAWRLGPFGFRSSAYNPCKIRGYSHPGRHPPAISLCLYLNTVHTHGLQFGVWSDTLEIAIQSLKKTKRERKGKEKRKKEKKKKKTTTSSGQSSSCGYITYDHLSLAQRRYSVCRLFGTLFAETRQFRPTIGSTLSLSTNLPPTRTLRDFPLPKPTRASMKWEGLIAREQSLLVLSALERRARRKRTPTS